MEYQISNSEEMQSLAEDFAKKLVTNMEGATVVGLYGDLGAGKTFFTQSVAKELGIIESIVSPTFVIEKIYELKDSKFSHLIHIDAYRIESSSELISLGFQKIISDPTNLILIEWPERVEDIMPKHTKIYIKHKENETAREVQIVV
jgi:tRNA threonylcarbamoyladenosine biosynthesis protein TsaE